MRTSSHIEPVPVDRFQIQCWQFSTTLAGSCLRSCKFCVAQSLRSCRKHNNTHQTQQHREKEDLRGINLFHRDRREAAGRMMAGGR